MNSSLPFSETVEIRGHIIDSLILPKILDLITAAGGRFSIKDISIGQYRNDSSYALVEIEAHSGEHLTKILAAISDHGAVPIEKQNCSFQPAEMDGVFPEGFFCTTNQRTQIRLEEEWVEVDNQEMDCGVVIDLHDHSATCLPMTEVQKGDYVVVGNAGTRVFPENRSANPHAFEFMNSSVSSEKPKAVAIREIAERFMEAREHGRTAIVGGPAIIHTGCSEQLCVLIRNGYIDCLLAGNALATHDIEQSMFGTSLGVHLDRGDIIEAGHEHHLRSINRIRRAGSIQNAVKHGILTSGVMYECIEHQVDFVLAGSIRDDGPLPDVITDTLDAQQAMREQLRDVTFCLMIATTLHSIAAGNLLPAWVNVVCVDINPSTVIKLSDRGSFQTVGLVTDVAPFMNQLIIELNQLNAKRPMHLSHS